MATSLLIAALIGLLLVSAPLFVLLGFLTALSYVLFGDARTFMEVTLLESVRELTDKQPLLAIPFFVLSGTIMSRGAIAERLVAVARATFKGLPGGLGIATVVACMFFAAISGSSPVTVITIGGVMYPALVAAGYPDKFSTGLVTSAGTLGILIPPSIPMIVYAIFASSESVIKVEDLFLAGVGPGMVIGSLLGAYCLVAGLKKGERFSAPSLRDIADSILEGFWALMLPVVILGGIYSGMFNATEAAAVSVVYALLVELFVHRQLELKEIPGVVGESTILMGSLLVIFAMAVGLNQLLSDLKVPDAAAAWITSLDLTPFTFMLILNGFLLIVGCLMDIMSAIMILVPLLAPLAAVCGIDPIHLGVVFIVNLELGYLTPPLGLNLFVSASIFDKPLGIVIKSVVPFTGLLLIAVAVVSYVPTISLGPVNVLNGRDFYVPFPSGGTCKAPEKAGEGDGLGDDMGFDDDLDDKPKGKKGASSINDLMKSGEFKDAWGDEDEDEKKDVIKEGGSSLKDLMKSGAYGDAFDEDDEDEKPKKPPDDGKAKTLKELMKEGDYKDAFDD